MNRDNKWAMLCKLLVHPFDDPAWVWERKLDGDRMKVGTDNNGVCYRLTARSGADKTAQFPELVGQVMATCASWLDGEVVSAQGLRFQEFNQRRMNRQRDIAAFAQELPAAFAPFDVLSCDAYPHAAKAELGYRLDVLDDVVYYGLRVVRHELVDDGRGVAMFDRAKAGGWEGVVGKRLDQLYLPNRRAWVKVKVWRKGVFRVTGWTDGQGRRDGVAGSFYVEDPFRNAVGKVGTGFDAAELRRLTGLAKGEEPVCVWVKYVERTNDGKLRLPVYMRQARPEEFCGENLDLPAD